MKTLVAVIAVVGLLGSTAYGGWYVCPRVVTAYYPLPPVYAYPAPMYAYPAPVPYAVFSPVAPAPRVVYSPLMVPAPVWYGPPGVVVRSKVYIPGRPVRNVVRAVLP